MRPSGRERASYKSPVPRELAEVETMNIGEELRSLGYKLEYEYGNSEDRTEVWINEKAGMAVRIEWMRVVGERGRDW